MPLVDDYKIIKLLKDEQTEQHIKVVFFLLPIHAYTDVIAYTIFLIHLNICQQLYGYKLILQFQYN